MTKKTDPNSNDHVFYTITNKDIWNRMENLELRMQRLMLISNIATGIIVYALKLFT